MDISVIIPVYNEEESLQELTSAISMEMRKANFSYEIILVDDGSTDESWREIVRCAQRNTNIKGICFRRNYGKSAALQKGFEASKGSVVITMDADLQDSPEEIPELYRMVKKDGYDIVSGWKKVRRDPLHKRIPSKIYNRTVRCLSGIKLHDMNCGLKAYKSDVVKNIELYGEMHRYIPIIAKWAGFSRVTEKVVVHNKRKHGKSKFGAERYMKGYLDLLTVMFISRYGKRPMHFFGLVGTLMFLAGFITSLYLVISRSFEAFYIPLTSRPLFYFALLFMILGTVLFVGGFLAELVCRNAPERNSYAVSSVYVPNVRKRSPRRKNNAPSSATAQKESGANPEVKQRREPKQKQESKQKQEQRQQDSKEQS